MVALTESWAVFQSDTAYNWIISSEMDNRDKCDFYLIALISYSNVFLGFMGFNFNEMTSFNFLACDLIFVCFCDLVIQI